MSETESIWDRAREAIVGVLGDLTEDIVMVGRGSDTGLYRNEEAILAALDAAGIALVDAAQPMLEHDCGVWTEMLEADVRRLKLRVENRDTRISELEATLAERDAEVAALVAFVENIDFDDQAGTLARSMDLWPIIERVRGSESEEPR